MPKFVAANTQYEEGDAEYDAGDFNFQITDTDDEIVALFIDEATRDRVLEFLNKE